MRRRAIILLAACIAASGLTPAGADDHDALAVVALIDSGINPYAPAFRDDSPRATQHPSTYIPGYPADATALHLTLDAPSLADALAADAAVWDAVRPRRLYWIPGTKIVGAISMSQGGRRCPRRVGAVDTYVPVTFPPPGGALNISTDCPERTILDDHGHGTSTASRAVGSPNSLAPDARVVMIEGLGTQSSQWAADQGWIDVQSNSWGFLTGLDVGATRAFREMAQQHLVVTASGNGLGFSGVAPEPTYVHALSAPGVVTAGGHDNGHITMWSGAPPQVVADAFAPYTALHDSIEPMRPDPVACCTSTATPYVAGGGARLILEARRILGHAGSGIVDGVVAAGPAGLVASGPLADGTFTLDELRAVLLATAEARPALGRDDGAMHFTGGPSAPRWLEGNATGENPYCQGCWTLPVRWTDVPPQVPAYADIGYGAVNERSIAQAIDVLSGAAAQPARPDEDAFFDLDTSLRETIWGI